MACTERVNGPLSQRVVAAVSGLLFALGFVCLPTCAALDDAALWLPARYQQKLAPQLRRAALKLEATERCERLLRGSLHDSSRGGDHAVFLLVCRDRQRKTFSVLADANTLEFTYLKKERPVDVPGGPSRADLLQVRREQLQLQCEALFVRKTRYMKNLQRKSVAGGQPEVDEQGIMLLRIPFDAESLQGRLLRYQAICSAPALLDDADASLTPTFIIKARKSTDRERP